MTDEPHTEAVDPAAEDFQAAADTLRDVIGGWCAVEQLNGTAPAVAATKLVDVLAGVLMEQMGGGAVRQALLTINEMTYQEPTTFSDRMKIKDKVDEIAQARRKAAGLPYVVLPVK